MAATILTTEINPFLDYSAALTKDLITGYGQLLNNPINGLPASGARQDAASMEALFIASFADLEAINTLGPSIYQMRGQTSHVQAIANTFSDLFSRLGQIAQGMGLSSTVVTLDSWFSYYNVGAGGTNLALQNPHIRYIMECIGLTPSKANFCYPVFTNHIGTQTGAVFTAGTKTVDTTKYVGGVPKLKFITRTSDNAVVTVTGECWDPATQTIQTGKTWVTAGAFTAALEEQNLVSGGGSPAPANALMTKATAMSGINAGNRFDARIYLPTGRTSLEWVV